MFSPNMVRFIIDPDDAAKKSIEKEVFLYSMPDHEKIINDYDFFRRVLQNFQKTIKVFASQSR